MRILVLYTRLTGYWMACMRNDRKRIGNVYLVIRKKPNKDAPFELESEEGIEIIDGDEYSREELERLASEFEPDLVYVAGWTDQRYRALAKTYRSKNIPVVLGMDNQWKGSLKQQTASIFAPALIKNFYSHIWIPGTPQFYFARKLGFSREEILTGLYCADENYFSQISQDRFVKQITFLGRLVEHKGLNVLFNVIEKLKAKDQLSFKIHLIGNGPLEPKIPEHPSIQHTPFVHPEKLDNYLTNAGFLILPSLYEAWGVVIHEAVFAGLPIVSTYQTGATSEFLIDGYNGFSYDAFKESELHHILLKLDELTEEEYLQYSRNSKRLSKRIQLDTWSATLNSII